MRGTKHGEPCKYPAASLSRGTRAAVSYDFGTGTLLAREHRSAPPNAGVGKGEFPAADAGAMIELNENKNRQDNGWNGGAASQYRITFRRSVAQFTGPSPIRQPSGPGAA